MAELPDAAFSVAGPMTALYRQLFHGHAVEVLDVPVHEGATPASLADCDGWMISGSPASVYDDLDWIRTGEEIVRAAHAEERPLIGICFGHQLIAQAMGGRVEKSAGGWGVGARAYDVVRPLPHFDGDTITLLASHQDQVVELPSEAIVWSSSDYCPVAGFNAPRTCNGTLAGRRVHDRGTAGHGAGTPRVHTRPRGSALREPPGADR